MILCMLVMEVFSNFSICSAWGTLKSYSIYMYIIITNLEGLSTFLQTHKNQLDISTDNKTRLKGD